MDIEVIRCDYAVVGSGIAGLWTAIHLAERGSVAVVTKSTLRESNTEYAQGGIAVALCPADSPRLHRQDTLEAGAGLCDEPAVTVLTEEGPQAVQELIARGAQFDREHGALLYGREAAHTTERIVHAHGDATGAEVERTAIEAARGLPQITTHERVMASELLVVDGQCVGLEGVRLPDGQRLRIIANATVLATGGGGWLYLYSTNPPVATADGVAIALRAGAAMQDLEFVQFHPTALAAPGYPKFLISEAVRGEGAVLVDQAGQPFMRRYHELADLAPRDIVARAMVTEMRRQGGECVRLDFSPIPRRRVRSRFPGILEELARRGFDPLGQPIPVTPAAHYMMGGIACDLHGRTTVRRLFACGECASYGVHGANRLASNSLLDGVVFGTRAARMAASLEPPPPDILEQASRAEPLPIAAGQAQWRELIQRVMWDEIGIIRTGEGMTRAEAVLRDLAGQIRRAQTPSQAEMEAANMAQAAWLVAAAALRRQESRGAHYRTDFPETSESWRRHIILALDPHGSLRLSLRPVLGG